MIPILEIVAEFLKKNVKVDAAIVLVIVYVVIVFVHTTDRIDAQAKEIDRVSQAQSEYNKSIKRLDTRMIHVEIMNAAMTRHFRIKEDDDTE